MKAIAAYMAAKTRDENNRRNEYQEPNGRDYDRRSEYGGTESRVYSERQPNQYPARDAMGEYQPEGNEMRRRRDSRGRYMIGEPMDRFRDDPYRNEERPLDNYSERRMDDDEDDKPMNVIQWPYGPETMPPESRTIGFGNRSHYDGGRQEAEVGGTMWMQPTEKDRSGMMMFDRETAEEWVHNMRNEDKNHPHGGKWTPESLKPFAQKYNIQYDTPKFWQFYAMTNAMYSDYSEVARKFGITSPEFYACMAKAFMDDMDAMPDKVARYYEYIAKK